MSCLLFWLYLLIKQSKIMGHKPKRMTIDQLAIIMAQSFAHFEKMMNERFEDMETKFNSKFDELNNKFDALQNVRVQNQERRLDQVVDDIRLIKTKLGLQ